MAPTGATNHPLDNAVWHALRGPQSSLAQWDASGRAGRFDPEVGLFSAVDRLDQEAWTAQAKLIGPGGLALFFRDEVPAPPPDWQEVFREPTWQLIAGDLAPGPQWPVERLGSSDVDAMLALTRLTEPGPFLPRTIELGTYLGVRTAHSLVAMAGERMRLPGFTEISAVCTHPDSRQKGYGAGLTLRIAEEIRSTGNEAFLHVIESNKNALRLYEAIGFRPRRRIEVVAAIWRGASCA